MNRKKQIAFLISSIFATAYLMETKVARALVTKNNPDNYLAEPDDFTGVVSIDFAGQQERQCTGSLLTQGRHVLTAAHCITGALNRGLTLDDINVVFSLPQRQVTRPVYDAFINPNWSDDGTVDRLLSFVQGGDVAVLELARQAPRRAEQYDIYTQFDEIGKVATIVGYGDTGTGLEGAVETNRGQQKLVGKNRFDALIDDLRPIQPLANLAISGSQLLIDFDSGSPLNNSLGPLGSDLGLDPQEVFPAAGDSGSPLLIGDKVAGLVSYGFGFPFIPSPPDVDTESNSSFGEVGINTRVSFYSDFISDAVAGRAADTSIRSLFEDDDDDEDERDDDDDDDENERDDDEDDEDERDDDDEDDDDVGFNGSTGTVTKVPEPTSTLGLLAFLCAGAALKRQKHK